MTTPQPALDRGTQRKLAWAALILIVVYLLARPWLERQLGMALPGGPAEQAATETPAPQAPGELGVSDAELKELVGTLGVDPVQPPVADVSVESAADEPPPTPSTPRKPKPRPTPPIAEGPQPSQNQSSQTPPETKPNTETGEGSAQPALGQLRTVGNKVYLSTAGLKYGPGSVDGHRLLHVLKHAADNPEKPIHGVYEGTKEEILALIDEAWLLVKAKSKQVQSAEEDDRTVYTIDMQRKIGFMGGEVGQRKNHPPCKKLRIVIEDENTVITAFPTDR